jgi:hypothetical protein
VRLGLKVRSVKQNVISKVHRRRRRRQGSSQIKNMIVFYSKRANFKLGGSVLEVDFEPGVIVAITVDSFGVDAACDVDESPK